MSQIFIPSYPQIFIPLYPKYLYPRTPNIHTHVLQIFIPSYSKYSYHRTPNIYTLVPNILIPSYPGYSYPHIPDIHTFPSHPGHRFGSDTSPGIVELIADATRTQSSKPAPLSVTQRTLKFEQHTNTHPPALGDTKAKAEGVKKNLSK